MSTLGIPLDTSEILSLPPSVVLYGLPGGGKSFEMARAFPNVLYVQSSPSILHAVAHYAQMHPGKISRIPDRITIDERFAAQHYGGSTIAAVVDVIERFMQIAAKPDCPYEGIVFDEWNVLCERMFQELKLDPWGKFKGRSGAINIFAVMDAFKVIHRSAISLARKTRKVVGFVCHYQTPKIDEDENSPTKGAIKWPGGPKMPMGLSDQVVEICADADVVLQLVVKDTQGNLLDAEANKAAGQRVFLTQLDSKWFRKVRGFNVEKEEILDLSQGKGLRELLHRAGYPV